MPMVPHESESRDEFLSRCIPDMIGTGSDKRPREQAVAICNDIWRNKDFCQDPETGLLCGSEPSGGSDTSTGDKPGSSADKPSSDKGPGSKHWNDVSAALESTAERLGFDKRGLLITSGK